MRFNVEVATLYRDKTWDSTWGIVEADNEESAKDRAVEDTLLDAAHHSESPENIAHVTAICIQTIE
jgi:hypothetical protein